MYYECHITIGPHHLSSRSLVEAMGWKFSYINGDPSFGEGSREYATQHADARINLEDVKAAMDRDAHILRQNGFPVIRQKVELVVYDTKGKS